LNIHFLLQRISRIATAEAKPLFSDSRASSALGNRTSDYVAAATGAGRPLHKKGTSVMGLLNNVLGSSVPGGSLAKPLGIALLAYLASRSGNNPAASGGGFGGLLSGGLGGLLGGLLGGSGAGMGSATLPADDDQAHSAVSGGLGELLQRFQQNGYGNVAGSWVGTGPNQPIAPHELQQALGPETVDDLSEQTGVPRNDLLSQLSQALPTLVDRLTPQGRIPEPDEMARSPQSGRVDV